MSEATASVIPGDRSLLIVEDDKSFLQRLARAMEGRGFNVTTAETVADGLDQVDLNTADGQRLADVFKTLQDKCEKQHLRLAYDDLVQDGESIAGAEVPNDRFFAFR